MRDTFRGSNLAKECVYKLFRNPKQNFILYFHSRFSTYNAKLCQKGTKSQRNPVASRNFYGVQILFYKNSRSYLFNAQFLESLDPFLTILALHANFMRCFLNCNTLLRDLMRKLYRFCERTVSNHIK